MPLSPIYHITSPNGEIGLRLLKQMPPLSRCETLPNILDLDHALIAPEVLKQVIAQKTVRSTVDNKSTNDPICQK